MDILGVLVITTEYGTGLTSTTTIAVLRCGTLFTAKATVIATLILIAGTALLGLTVTPAAFRCCGTRHVPDRVLILPALSQNPPESIADPEVLTSSTHSPLSEPRDGRSASSPTD
ncbi:hypothetical protein [Actinoalloteichus spitiensis]|uniref:hypothetical protein n=1 Tax=Actinoalloteichus spitiensis TaxID=252394 RepID=UPI0002EF3EF7|nr:hypothetical protein [Actinoalloteichus spitiensis]